MRGVSARQEDPALPHLDAILMPSQGRGKEKAQWIHFTSPQEETSWTCVSGELIKHHAFAQISASFVSSSAIQGEKRQEERNSRVTCHAVRYGVTEKRVSLTSEYKDIP